MSNIKVTKKGLIEKSTGRKIKSPMDAKNVEIINKLKYKLKSATTTYENEAWANALKSFMIALSIQKDLELKLANS